MAKKPIVIVSRSELRRVSTQGKPGDWKPTLTVELSEEDGSWNAECKTVDYIACGATVEAAKENFSDGLMMTAYMHKQLRPDHSCLICQATGKGLVVPNFDWKFIEGETV